MRLAGARDGEAGFTLEGWIMHPGRAIVVLLGLATLAFPTQAAPLNQDLNQSPGPAAADGDRILPGPPMARAKATAVLADRDGNRLSDGLEAMLSGLGPDESIDVIVTFSGPGNAAAAQAAVGAFDVRHEYHLIQGFAATMTAAQAQAMAGVAGVFRVEEDATATIFLEAARADFGVDRLYDPLALPVEYTGEGITVCVIDTGIMATHEVFDSKSVIFKDFIGDIFGDIQTAPYDDNGHGTHVASIIAGDGTPIASQSDPTDLAWPLRGVARQASIVSAKVMNADGAGTVSGIIAGIEWCSLSGPEYVGDSVDVINMSLGIAGSSDCKDSLCKAANKAVEAGKVVVVSGGNSGAEPKTIGSPAAGDQVITVGAEADHSADPADPWFSAGVFPAPYSSRGPTKDGRIKPDIMGPGVTIAAAYSDYFGQYLFSGCPDPKKCYLLLSGTSMASPFVAGIAALVLQANPDLSPAEVAQILYDTARVRAAAPGKNNETGHGLVDAYTATTQAPFYGTGAYDPTASPTALPSVSFGSGSVADFGETWIDIEVMDTQKPLAVTITVDGRFKCFQRMFGSCTVWGWDPDIEAQLFDDTGQAFMVLNPFYIPGWEFLFGPEFIPQPGTVSTCPAGSLCGLAGRQETIYFAPPLATAGYKLKLFPYPDTPNDGAGGTFSYEISNGQAAAPVVANQPPMANAGPDQSVEVANNPASVNLDGSLSDDPDGTIMSYDWTENGNPIATGETPTVQLGYGTHNILLTVKDDDLATDSDEVLVTVVDPNATNQPPTADAGPDQEVNYNKKTSTANVNLDGSGSFDPDGSIVGYEWSEDGTVIASGVTATVTLDKAASHTITLTVTDNQGATHADTVVVTEKVKGGGKGGGKGAGNSTAAR
jgi:serine protease AprX